MKKNYITSLKGIACFFVAVGHFLGTIKYASNIPLDTQWLSFFNFFHLGFLLNESFWLYIFFVVSGYLVASSQVENLSDFFIRCITRFLRLGLPILFACFFIFLLSKIIPFYNDDTKAFFENNWLQSAFSQRFSFVDLILSPFSVLLFKKTLFNSPYWVLRSMMFSSFLIYLITYINSKAKSNILRFAFNLSILIISYFFDIIIFSCIWGALLFYYENNLKIAFKSKIALYLCGLISFTICFVNYIYGAILFFSWLIITLPQFTAIKKLIENKALRFLGKISFGIYSFHWPLFCSIGSLFIVKLWNITEHGFALFSSMVVSMATTIILSIIYYHTVENYCERLVGWTRKKLKLLFASNDKVQ